MINQTGHNTNFVLTNNYVKQNENEDQKKATTKISIAPESEILASNLDTTNTSIFTNKKFKSDLTQRIIETDNTDLIDIINQKTKDEIANSPECTVYFIPYMQNTNTQVRFTEAAKDNFYKEGFSKAEIDDAIKTSNETYTSDTFKQKYDSRYYVNNLKINNHIKKASLPISDFFEFCYIQSEKWEKVNRVKSSVINEVMLHPRYIRISNDEYNQKLTTDKKKFINDRVSQYLSAITDILSKELYSNKSPQEKIKNLQGIISLDDAWLSNDSLQEEAHLQPSLTDIISQKTNDEIANSPKCTVYFIPFMQNTNTQVRFTEVAKDNFYKAGFSKAEVDDAIKTSSKRYTSDAFKYNYDSHYYVNNLKINNYIKKSSLPISDFFEFSYIQSENWEKVNRVDSSVINEVMLNPRYIRISNDDYNQELKTDKKKFINDKVFQYLFTTINSIRKDLYSNKSPQEKVVALACILNITLDFLNNC
jgi:hypothetical protein